MFYVMAIMRDCSCIVEPIMGLMNAIARQGELFNMTDTIDVEVFSYGFQYEACYGCTDYTIEWKHQGIHPVSFTQACDACHEKIMAREAE